MKKILTESTEKSRIARLLNCSPQMVRKALRGESETDLAWRIRKLALERGGNYMRTKQRNAVILTDLL
jgi:hypothetical protein